MNFSWKNGLIWVDISLEYNGVTYQIEHCIVDTGSAGTAVDIEQIEFDYNRPTQIKRLTGIGVTQEVMSQKIKSLYFLVPTRCVECSSQRASVIVVTLARLERISTQRVETRRITSAMSTLTVIS